MGKKNRKGKSKGDGEGHGGSGSGAADRRGGDDCRAGVGGKKGGEDRFDTSTKPQFRIGKTGGDGKSGATTATKVVLDERFASVLTDPRFQVDVRDKYGRGKRAVASKKKKKKGGGGGGGELSEFYTVVAAENEEEDEGGQKRPSSGKASSKEDGSEGETCKGKAVRSSKNDDDEDGKRKDGGGDDDSSASSSSSSSSSKSGGDGEKADDSKGDNDNDNNPASRIAYLTALSRGQLDVSSSSSSSDDDDQEEEDGEGSSSDEDDGSDDEGGDGENPYGTAGILDPSSKGLEEEGAVEMTEEPSPYLAVMNLDWTHVRAVDVFALLASFASAPGSLRRVGVYLSDFGREQLDREQKYGPSDVWRDKSKRQHQSKTGGDQDDDDDNDDPAGDHQPGDDESDHNKEEYGEEDDYSGGDDDDMFADEEGLPKADYVDSGFDMEKLRAYEASKLRYYFAVAEFSSPEHADAAYHQVDGMEFEHSSAAVDLRSIPPDQLDGVVKDRTLRDEATSIPSNYVPPDFVVGALQQSSVQCTWEIGDRERERTLTKYHSGADAWKSLADGNELHAYLASDVSSDDGGDDVDSDDEKVASKRKMLGLVDSDSDLDLDEKEIGRDVREHSSSSSQSSSSSEESGAEDEMQENEEEDNMAKEVTFVPGQKKSSLESKIRSKLESKSDEPKELTPWEKYQEKRKQKRREKRQAAREKRKEINEIRRGGGKETSARQKQEEDDFFVDDDSGLEKKAATKKQTAEELELLLAGDEKEDKSRDFDMRELQRLEKNKNKKLHGSRKRKEKERAAAVTGTDFKVDTHDARFSAVLDGQDDRFGIDRTDPQFKETTGMQEILTEQARRRKQKRRKKSNNGEDKVVPDVNADDSGGGMKGTGASALSALVRNIKSKVNQ